MVLGLLSHAASVAIGALYPAFKTFKVIREGNYSLMKKWLKYWTVYAGFLAAETVGDALLLQYIIPGYLLLKLSFLLWAASPWTEGASVIHQKFIAPLLTAYEQDIDEMLDNMRYSVQRQISRLGNGALDKARVGLLSLAASEVSSTAHEVFASQSPSVTVAMEEQAEEDVVFVTDKSTRIKVELEDHERSTSAGAPGCLGRGSGSFHDAPVTCTKTRRARKNRKTAGGAVGRQPGRTRRVMADRSVSHER